MAASSHGRRGTGQARNSSLRIAAAAMLAAVVAVQPAAGQDATAPAIPATAPPVELTPDSLDHWLATMRRVGGDASLQASGQAADPTLLAEVCTRAGFASVDECGCTVLYVSVLMTGFDREAKAFIDPAVAARRRLSAAIGRKDLDDADIASLRADRRLVGALQQAMPAGVPAAHLALLGTFMTGRMPQDVAAWQELSHGLRSGATRAIGDQCTRLPALTATPG